VVVGGVLIATAGSQLRDALDTYVQGFELLSDDAFGHIPTQVLHQKSHTAVLREREGVDTQPSFPSRGRSALTEALNPSAVDGTTINFSPFSWAVRARRPQPCVTSTCNENGRVIRTLSCW